MVTFPLCLTPHGFKSTNRAEPTGGVGGWISSLQIILNELSYEVCSWAASGSKNCPLNPELRAVNDVEGSNSSLV